jgi:hypothetical protein
VLDFLLQYGPLLVQRLVLTRISPCFPGIFSVGRSG